MPARLPDARATSPGLDPLAELITGLPDGTVITDPDVVEAFRHDQAPTVAAGHPRAVVRAGGPTGTSSLRSHGVPARG